VKHKTLWLVVALTIAFTGPVAAADTLTIDKSHSEVGFRIRHLVSKVAGRFADFSGTITADAAKPEMSAVQFTIQAGSIDTANAKRDEHLRSADFFDVAKFPTIEFKSRKVTPAGKDRYDVAGTLTMHGVSRDVTLPVGFLGLAKDPWGNERAGFELALTLNRKDYGIVWNTTLDSGGLLLGEDVAVAINLEAIKAKPGATP
jgi:polyisoprenoid-binding protein YceI